MKVVEIFDSVEGEGKRVGQSATFIRFAGCNLRCSYCDTTYALFGEAEDCVYTDMSVEEILKKVNTDYKRVTLTGGEPLMQEGIDTLIQKLCDMGIEVNIETNGTINTKKYSDNPNVFVTIDYKLPSSSESDKMDTNNFICLDKNDVIKFVAGNREDIDVMENVVAKLKCTYSPDKLPIMYTGAVFGEIEPSELVNQILNSKTLKDVIFQLQIHKFIWNPEERGV